MVQWYSLNRNALNPATGKADFASLLNSYHLKERCSRRRLRTFRTLAPRRMTNKRPLDFSICSSDADGVLRRALLVLPFGRSSNPDDIDLYGSLEVPTLRLYLGLKTEQVTVNTGQRVWRRCNSATS